MQAGESFFSKKTRMFYKKQQSSRLFVTDNTLFAQKSTRLISSCNKGSADTGGGARFASEQIISEEQP